MTIRTDLQPVVQCLALSKVFQDFWGRDKVLAVDKLDLDVYPGEVAGLLGPNGSGKSTLLRILCGALKADAGRVETLGADPKGRSAWLRSQVSYVPQHQALDPEMTGRETLTFLCTG